MRGETLQDLEKIARAINAIYSNFYAANTPKVYRREMVDKNP
jgi:hypothetical protein